MSNVDNLRDTIVPKSDQLNADDLTGTTLTIKVTDVRRGSADQPVSIHYEGDDGRPYKPGKSMRRVLIYLWGDNGREWVGRSMTLYCDPDIKFGGVKVGGIRISHLSHIEGTHVLQLTATRGNRQPYTVKAIEQAAPYPADLFKERVEAWVEAIAAGKMTAEQVIKRAEQTGPLTEGQKAEIRSKNAAEAEVGEE